MKFQAHFLHQKLRGAHQENHDSINIEWSISIKPRIYIVKQMNKIGSTLLGRKTYKRIFEGYLNYMEIIS